MSACTDKAIITQNCTCGSGSCTYDGTNPKVCDANNDICNAISDCPTTGNITEDCICGTNTCTYGASSPQTCTSGTCTAVTPDCPTTGNITEDCICGTNTCTYGASSPQTCTSGTCTAVTPDCPTTGNITEDCICGTNTCSFSSTTLQTCITADNECKADTCKLGFSAISKCTACNTINPLKCDACESTYHTNDIQSACIADDCKSGASAITNCTTCNTTTTTLCDACDAGFKLNDGMTACEVDTAYCITAPHNIDKCATCDTDATKCKKCIDDYEIVTVEGSEVCKQSCTGTLIQNCVCGGELIAEDVICHEGAIYENCDAQDDATKPAATKFDCKCDKSFCQTGYTCNAAATPAAETKRDSEAASTLTCTAPEKKVSNCKMDVLTTVAADATLSFCNCSSDSAVKNYCVVGTEVCTLINDAKSCIKQATTDSGKLVQEEHSYCALADGTIKIAQKGDYCIETKYIQSCDNAESKIDGACYCGGGDKEEDGTCKENVLCLNKSCQKPAVTKENLNQALKEEASCGNTTCAIGSVCFASGKSSGDASGAVCVAAGVEGQKIETKKEPAACTKGSGTDAVMANCFPGNSCSAKLGCKCEVDGFGPCSYYLDPNDESSTIKNCKSGEVFTFKDSVYSCQKPETDVDADDFGATTKTEGKGLSESKKVDIKAVKCGSTSFTQWAGELCYSGKTYPECTKYYAATESCICEVTENSTYALLKKGETCTGNIIYQCKSGDKAKYDKDTSSGKVTSMSCKKKDSGLSAGAIVGIIIAVIIVIAVIALAVYFIKKKNQQMEKNNSSNYNENVVATNDQQKKDSDVEKETKYADQQAGVQFGAE